MAQHTQNLVSLAATAGLRGRGPIFGDLVIRTRLCCVLPSVHGSSVSEQTWNDADVVAQLRQGDKGALARLYDEYSGLVYGVARRVLRDATAAEDVVQEEFSFSCGVIKFLLMSAAVGWLPGSRSSGSPQGRGLIAQAETQSRFGRAADGRAATQQSETTGHSPLTTRTRPERLMSQLPTEQKQALELAYLDGLTHVEIAARTGEPLGTVKSRIRLGLHFLRKEIAP